MLPKEVDQLYANLFYKIKCLVQKTTKKEQQQQKKKKTKLEKPHTFEFQISKFQKFHVLVFKLN